MIFKLFVRSFVRTFAYSLLSARMCILIVKPRHHTEHFMHTIQLESCLIDANRHVSPLLYRSQAVFRSPQKHFGLSCYINTFRIEIHALILCSPNNV